MNQEDAAEMMARYLRKEATAEDMADLLIPNRPVDLREVPREKWKVHLLGNVKLPDDVRAFIDGQKEFTQDELDHLEDRIATFYGVTAPYYITCNPGPPFEAWLGKETAR